MIYQCLFCGGAPGERIETREMMFGLRNPFTYRRCVDCGSLWLENVPKDLAPYYPRTYGSMRAPAEGPPIPIPIARQLTRILLKLPEALVRRLAGRRGFPIYLWWFQGLGVSLSSRIADVGSGTGSLVLRMAKHGFDDVWGFDPFIKDDRDAGHAHIRRSGIQGADGVFDVVMFNHSLEHVPQPVEALRQAKAHLTPDGYILLRVPLAGSYADQHYGANWVALDPPRHLNVPSQRGMRVAADAVGLKITRVFFDSLPLQFWGSEQYAKDIPLFDAARSARDNPDFERWTRDLNRRHEGDSAGFILCNT